MLKKNKIHLDIPNSFPVTGLRDKPLSEGRPLGMPSLHNQCFSDFPYNNKYLLRAKVIDLADIWNESAYDKVIDILKNNLSESLDFPTNQIGVSVDESKVEISLKDVVITATQSDFKAFTDLEITKSISYIFDNLLFKVY